VPMTDEDMAALRWALDLLAPIAHRSHGAGGANARRALAAISKILGITVLLVGDKDVPRA